MNKEMVTTSALPQKYIITFYLLMTYPFEKQLMYLSCHTPAFLDLIDEIVRYGDFSEHVQALFGPYKSFRLPHMLIHY
jgi:hypothetical protein